MLLVWICPLLYNYIGLSGLTILPTDILLHSPTSTTSIYVAILHLISHICNEFLVLYHHENHLQVTESCAKIGNMSINSGAGGWINIWLFSVDVMLVNILDGYMEPIILTLTKSPIGSGGGRSPRLRLSITIDKWSNLSQTFSYQVITTSDFMSPYHHTYWIICVNQDTLL